MDFSPPTFQYRRPLHRNWYIWLIRSVINQDYKNRLIYGSLLTGITLIGLAFYPLQTIWTSRESLAPLHGTIRSADVGVRTITSTNRLGLENQSQVSEIIFYLNEYEHKFWLRKNIGQSYYVDDLHSSLLKELRRSDSVTIWIRASQLDNSEPKVLQIDGMGHSTLLPLETTKEDQRYLAAFLLTSGLAMIALFLRLKYPVKFRKFFSDPPSA